MFINPEKFSYIEEPDLEYKYFKKLSYCFFEGVVPWGGKYIRIDKLQDYVPLENLECLRSRCYSHCMKRAPNFLNQGPLHI